MCLSFWGGPVGSSLKAMATVELDGSVLGCKPRNCWIYDQVIDTALPQTFCGIPGKFCDQVGEIWAMDCEKTIKQTKATMWEQTSLFILAQEPEEQLVCPWLSLQDFPFLTWGTGLIVSHHLTKSIERMGGCEAAFRFKCGESEVIEKRDVSHWIRRWRPYSPTLVQDNKGKPKEGESSRP